MTVTDAVCQMPIESAVALRVERDGETFFFCSEFCRRQFERRGAAYGRPGTAPVPLAWPAVRVAYFSMEVAFRSNAPTYAGGLGVLAGDHLQACADLGVAVVGVSLVHHMGYVKQRLRDGAQEDEPSPWSPESSLQRLPVETTVQLEGQDVHVGGWQTSFVGSGDHVVPLVLLDTDHPENDAWSRTLTDHLYGGDRRYRLAQEIVLAVGGVRLLQALGCSGLTTFHLNEGHAALVPVELLRRRVASGGQWDFADVRRRCVFTTHTPVAAGHDRFDRTLLHQLLPGFIDDSALEMLGGKDDLNMTALALNLSHYVNGVALRHREVSSSMFPEYEIHQITNGVHSQRWTSRPIQALFDRRIPGWRSDPWMLRNATALPDAELKTAHVAAKGELLKEIEIGAGARLDPAVLTIGFARRATAYKRATLIFRDLDRLRAIAGTHPLQLVYAGIAHPDDGGGKEVIREVLAFAERLGAELPVVYLEGYDVDLALKLTAGVDVWLNTPLRPLEASGTSGMKAALNGVPSLSVLDGWWREGHIEGVTGWSIGAVDPLGGEEADRADSADLYAKLEDAVLPAFYGAPDVWTRIMKQTIAINGSFFNAHRMAQQYVEHAYAL